MCLVDIPSIFIIYFTKVLCTYKKLANCVQIKDVEQFHAKIIVMSTTFVHQKIWIPANFVHQKIRKSTSFVYQKMIPASFAYQKNNDVGRISA